MPAVAANRAEQTVVWTMRLLAAAFAVTGLLFIATPDGVIGALDDAGAELGEFAPGPDSDQRLWLGLGFSYMVVITGLAVLVQSDVVRFRPLLLLLAAGKASSSLAAGAFFLFDDDVFAYLVNFVVDGGLVLVALWCWALAGRAAGGRAAAETAPEGAPTPRAAAPERATDGPARPSARTG